MYGVLRKIYFGERLPQDSLQRSLKNGLEPMALVLEVSVLSGTLVG